MVLFSMTSFLLSLPEGEEEPGSMRQWAATYRACDALFMLSGTGERFGYRQMARLGSPLTREGREICQAMADRMGKPWYYYLHRYYSSQSKTCPGCGG